jgi:predicted RNA methylase
LPSSTRRTVSLRRIAEQLGQDLLAAQERDGESIYHDVAILILRAQACRFRGLAHDELDHFLPAPGGAGVTHMSLSEHRGSAPDILSETYEALLRLRPSVSEGCFRLTPAREHRRSGGIFYTPAPIARRVTAATLAAAPLARPRILDPAMGAGAFLVEAVRALAARGVRPVEAAESCLFGVDRDPLAVRIAALCLWLETGADPDILSGHLICADALTDDPAPADIVLGNPPWGALPARTDSFKQFTELAARVADHALGLVLPHAVLLQTGHADVRAHLLQRFAPYAVLDLGTRWFSAAAPACALVFGPKPGPSRIAATRMLSVAPNSARHGTITRSRWSERGFPPAAVDGLVLLERIGRCHPTLGSLNHIVRVHDTGINYRTADVARKVLYRAEAPADPRDLPRFRGRDFHRYTGIRRDGWIRFEGHDSSPSRDRLTFDRTLPLLPEKIVVRQTADRVIATVDRTGMVMGRSVIAVTVTRPEILLPLLACLNSRLLLALYQALSGEAGRILPQVKVARLHALPVPRALVEDGEKWKCLARLATDMLTAEGRDPSLDRRLDREVSTLYEVDERDVEIALAL